MTRALPASILAPAFDALQDRGLTRPFIQQCYLKWQAQARAADCRFGIERNIAVDCNCPGCHEVLVFLFFDQAAKTFAMVPR